MSPLYQVQQRSNLLTSFAVFSATAWNFCEILHVYVSILPTLKCQVAFNNL